MRHQTRPLVHGESVSSDTPILGQDSQEYDPGLLVSPFSTSGYLTPEPSLSDMSSRRPSVASCSSSGLGMAFSGAYLSPRSPEPNSEYRGQPFDFSSPTPLRSYTAMAGASTNPGSLDEHFSVNASYIYTTPSPSSSGGFGYGCVDDEILTAPSFPRKDTMDWRILNDAVEPSENAAGIASQHCFLEQSDVYDPLACNQASFNINYINRAALCAPEGTVLPSQTEMYGSNSFLDSPTSSIRSVSSYDHTVLSSRPEDVESTLGPKISYFKSDQKVLAVVVKRSDSSKLWSDVESDHTSLVQKKSKPAATAKQSSSQGNFDHWDPTNDCEILALKTECTAVTSHGSKKYLCNICPRGFDRQEHWRRHIITKTHRENLRKVDKNSLGEDPPTFPCRVCRREFNRQDNLKAHEIIHFPSKGKTRKITPPTVEESLRLGFADIDPRINPNLKKSSRKKIRPHL